MSVPGLHHVTAISGRTRRNLDFYTRTLGLRLVKKTVNFDDPSTYHLYYGDEIGHPGTVLTFFPWEHAAAGRAGVGSTREIAFRVSADSFGYWTHRFVAHGVTHEPLATKFGERVLSFRDPDGLRLVLVGAADSAPSTSWAGSDVPLEHAIRGFHGVTLLLEDKTATGAMLTTLFGYNEIGSEGAITRYRVADQEIGGTVDIHASPGFLKGRMGRGSVHHIAFRAKDDAVQADMARRVREKHAIETTAQLDRRYFRSVYFREPGGVLFEIATDDPGFTVDEARDDLGTALKLPPFLEPRRSEIETALPPLETS
jgi:glyoxalase family protein